jgi:hypothetical protein
MPAYVLLMMKRIPHGVKRKINASLTSIAAPMFLLSGSFQWIDS